MTEMQKSYKDWYATHFERLASELKSAGGSWLWNIREKAIARFQMLGFPTIRDEDWRYTNVNPIAVTPFEPAASVPVTAADLKPYLVDDAVACLVLVNGRFSAELSRLSRLPEGVVVCSLKEALNRCADLVQPHLTRYAAYEEQPFAALNTALFGDGVFVQVAQGTVLEKPVHVLYVSRGGEQAHVAHPRNLILAAPNSQVTVIETYAGLGGAYFNNAVTELVVQENAVLDHYKIERESLEAFHLSVLQVHQGRSGTVRSTGVSFGGTLVRNDIGTVLDGEGGHCSLNGLYMLKGTQHVDNHLRVEHAQPHCDSREYFKGVLDDASRGIFAGRIIVRKGAQKTDAKQTNMSLLLSDHAQVESKPQLEIFADDVKCTHGATIGQINDEAVFYLRSRGIGESEARSLLVHAFAGEIIEKVKPEALRHQLEALILQRLADGRVLREPL